MEPVELVTSNAMGAGRLHLRPWNAGDVDTVLRAGTDPAVQRWTTVPAPYTRADAEDFVTRYVPQSWADDGELVWAVCDATSGAPLGCLGLHSAHAERVRLVGFWCLPEARGLAVVPDALQAVARWAFAALGLARLEWAAEVGNAASLRVAIKAGFAFEGRRRAALRRRDGSRVDGWWAARLPADGEHGVPPALPNPGVLLAGDLRLRRWRESDVPALAAAISAEPDALRSRPGATSEERARWWATEGAQEAWATGHGAPLAVLDAAGRVVGSLQLDRKGRRDGIAEVGVWLAPSVRRQGAATAAVGALLEWAEPALALSRVEWHAAPDNAASLALAARLGFVREGVARAALPGPPRGDAVLLARTCRTVIAASS